MSDALNVGKDIPMKQYRTRFTSVSVKDFVGQLHGVDLQAKPWEIYILYICR